MNSVDTHYQAIRERTNLADTIVRNYRSLMNWSDRQNRMATSQADISSDPVYQRIEELREHFEKRETEGEHFDYDPMPVLTILRLQMLNRAMGELAYGYLSKVSVKSAADMILTHPELLIPNLR